jgi:branched-chain amino acid transport system permease protein
MRGHGVSSLLRHLAIAVVAGVALFVLSGRLSQFDNLQLATMAYYFVAVAGLTVLTGLNGQISLGHGALMAVGAYTTAKLLGEDGTGPPLALVLAGATVAGAVAGLLAGAAAARLRGPYLAGATLALAVGLPAIALRFPGFLGASDGLTVFPPTAPAALGETFALERWQACIACLAALLAYVVLANLMRSRLGRDFRAVRDDEVAAELAGLHVARTQVTAFVVSAACAGLGGGLLAVVTQLAAPGAFDLSLSLALLTGIVLGGLGSLPGALWGAIVLVMLPSWSDDIAGQLSLSNDVKSNLPLALYGIVLMGVIVAAPEGIQGAFRRLGRLLWVRPSSVPREEGA